MKHIVKSDMQDTLLFLIQEAECEIQNCEALKITYQENMELVHMYTTKIMHYQFMICRLRRHLLTNPTPHKWCSADRVIVDA